MQHWVPNQTGAGDSCNSSALGAGGAGSCSGAHGAGDLLGQSSDGGPSLRRAGCLFGSFAFGFSLFAWGWRRAAGNVWLFFFWVMFCVFFFAFFVLIVVFFVAFACVIIWRHADGTLQISRQLCTTDNSKPVKQQPCLVVGKSAEVFANEIYCLSWFVYVFKFLVIYA